MEFYLLIYHNIEAIIITGCLLFLRNIIFQAYHIAYVIVKSANSPRPGIWALERSNDNGKTFLPWHYFASSPSECRSYFGVDPYLPIQDDDTVLCSTEYSQIPPFTDGEVSIDYFQVNI